MCRVWRTCWLDRPAEHFPFLVGNYGTPLAFLRSMQREIGVGVRQWAYPIIFVDLSRTRQVASAAEDGDTISKSARRWRRIPFATPYSTCEPVGIFCPPSLSDWLNSSKVTPPGERNKIPKAV